MQNQQRPADVAKNPKIGKKNGHRLAEKVSARSFSGSHVLTRIRQQSQEQYSNSVYL